MSEIEHDPVAVDAGELNNMWSSLLLKPAEQSVSLVFLPPRRALKSRTSSMSRAMFCRTNEALPGSGRNRLSCAPGLPAICLDS